MRDSFENITDNIQKYVSDELAKIIELDEILTNRLYNKKKQIFQYTIQDMKWIGLNSFVDIIMRKLRHIFGKDLNDYLEISYKIGSENLHSFDCILNFRVLIDLDTLAGYLRLTQEKREKLV